MAYSTVLFIFALVFVLDRLKRWVTAYMNKPRRTAEITEMEAEMKQLKADAAKLNSIDTFVQLSKCQRKINKLEKDLAVKRVEAANEHDPYREYARVFLMLPTTGLMYATFTYIYWNDAVMEFPAVSLAPASYILGMPWFPAGSVCAIAWIGICNRVCSKYL
eukprot:GFYU01005510.1.p1 GENE.GFYU01005510.1~~GFYU01005510.1.p1  ORF type:complete len:177 (-),score=29.27 GFYU01005510.1:180-665(-)